LNLHLYLNLNFKLSSNLADTHQPDGPPPHLMNTRTLLLFFFGLTIAAPISLLAQECELSLHGRVMEADAQTPLAYAYIRIPEVERAVVADSLGYYQITGLCPGTYTLVCSHIDCGHQIMSCELDHGSEAYDFHLLKHHLTLKEVNILGERMPDKTTQAQVQLQGIALDQQLGQSLGDALANIAGVNLLKTGSTIAKPIIHGLHSNRVLVLNHGIRLEGQQWGSEHAPEIDPFLATQLSVVKGAQSVRYGAGAMGGVILVEPPALPQHTGHVHGHLHLRGYSNGRQGVGSGTLEGKLKAIPLSWRVQGTAKQGGNMHTPAYYLENTGLRERNFSVNLGSESFRRGISVFYNRFHTQLGILSPAHVNSELDLQRAMAREIPLGADTVGFTYQLKRPFQDIRHHLLKVQAYQRITEAGKLSFNYAWQFNHRREYDKHRPRGTDENGEEIAELDFRIHTHTLEGLWEHNPKGNWRGIWGVLGLYQNNFLRGRPFIPNYVALGAEAFVIERYQKQRWEAELGLRYDYRWIHSAREEGGKDIYTIRTFQNVSATVGGRVELTNWLELSANVGTAWRPPHVNELFSNGLHHGAAAVEQGDSTLNPEQSLKAILNLEWNHPSGWRGMISPYFQRFQNFIYQRPDGFERTIRGTFPLLVYSQTAARLQGVDVAVNYDAPWGLQWEGQYSYLDAWNLSEEQALIFMPPNRLETMLGYRFADRGQIKAPFIRAGIRHVAEQKKVPLGEDLLPPPPAYTLTHLEGGLSWDLHSGSLDLGFQIDNLFNVQYRAYLNRLRYFADEPGRNISIRLKYSF
jgi:iron complex outermembrane receptor protein